MCSFCYTICSKFIIPNILFLLCHLCLYPLLYSKGIFHDASLCITFLQRGAQAYGMFGLHCLWR